MRDYTEILVERQSRREARRARMQAQRLYNQDVRDELHDNFLENQQAFHQDCIRNQLTRQQLTAIWFPGIAASAAYQTYVAHNIAKHERKINKLELDLNGKLYGEQPIEKVEAEIIPATNQQ